MSLLYRLLSLLLVVVVLSNYSIVLAQNTEEANVVSSINEANLDVVEQSVSDTYSDNYAKEKLPNNDVFNDFVIGPGKFELELAPGESKTVELMVSNRMGERKLFELTTEDAEGSITGEVAVSLLGERVGPYTLKDFISVPQTKFYLEHAERARIPVTISIPADAEPGGRYGSILTSITTSPEDLGEQGGAQPSSVVISRIGTLFFVTTPGDIDRSGELSSFTTKNSQKVFFKPPIDFNLTFENKGSVHLNPYGNIVIKNIFGEEVGHVELQPWFVMPQSIRNREVTWDRGFMIGRYVATAEVYRGYDEEKDSLTFTFWVVPWLHITIVFVIVLITILLLRFIVTRFEFKRKV